jgi:hypothetical protein
MLAIYLLRERIHALKKFTLCLSLMLAASSATAFDEGSFVSVAKKYAAGNRIVERDDEGYRGILVYPSDSNKMLYFIGHSIEYERSNSSAISRDFPKDACSRVNGFTVCDDKSLFMIVKDYPATKQAISITMNRVQAASGFKEEDIDNIKRIFSSVVGEFK